ncbi:hypothetical protein ACM66B_003331 [Microbotryomycetes sp. NB124-2]
MTPATRTSAALEWAAPLSEPSSTFYNHTAAGVDDDHADEVDGGEGSGGYLSTPAGELALFRALIEHRPVGVDKHWEMLQVALSLGRYHAQQQQDGDEMTTDDAAAAGEEQQQDTNDNKRRKRTKNPLDDVDSAALWAKYRDLYDEDTLWSTWEGEQLDKMDTLGLLPPTPDSESDQPPLDPTELCMSFRFPKREFTLVPHVNRIDNERGGRSAWDKGLVGEFSQRIAERAKRDEEGQDHDSPESLPVTEFEIEVPSDWEGRELDENGDDRKARAKNKAARSNNEPGKKGADESDDDDDDGGEEQEGDEGAAAASGARRRKPAGRESPKGRGARSRAATKAVNDRVKERQKKQAAAAASSSKAGSTTATPPSKRKGQAREEAEDDDDENSGSDLSELEDATDTEDDDDKNEHDSAADEDDDDQAQDEGQSDSALSGHESPAVGNTCKESPKCTAGQFLSDDARKCIKCDDKFGNAASCNSTTVATCKTTFTLKDNSCQCIDLPVLAADGSKCETCGARFENAATCDSKGPKTCVNNLVVQGNKCVCETGRYMTTKTGETAPSCLPCKELYPNSATCNKDQLQTCLPTFQKAVDPKTKLYSCVCKDGQYVRDGACVACDGAYPLSNTCNESAPLTCQGSLEVVGAKCGCKDGSFVQKTGNKYSCASCTKYGTNVATCSSAEATSCSNGYSLSSDKKTCVCSSPKVVKDGKCVDPPLACQGGSSLVNGKCVCPSGTFSKDNPVTACFTCSASYKYAKTCDANKVIDCQDNFTKAADEKSCSCVAPNKLDGLNCVKPVVPTCSNGSVMVDNKCACPSGTFSKDDPVTACYTCSANYKYAKTCDANKVIDCQDNFTKAADEKSCSCVAPNKLDGLNCVKPVVPTCSGGAVLVGNVCTCPSGTYSKDDASPPTLCTACLTKYPNSLTCTSTKVMDCRSGFEKSADATSCDCPAKTKKIVNGECVSLTKSDCPANANFLNGSCVCVDTTYSETDVVTSCKSCVAKYPYADHCTRDQITQCAENFAITTNGTKCECLSPNTLQGNACIRPAVTPTNCGDNAASVDGKCQCNDGFATKDSEFFCLPCSDYDKNWATCVLGSAPKPLSCKNGFLLEANECICATPKRLDGGGQCVASNDKCEDVSYGSTFDGEWCRCPSDQFFYDAGHGFCVYCSNFRARAETCDRAQVFSCKAGFQVSPDKTECICSDGKFYDYNDPNECVDCSTRFGKNVKTCSTYGDGVLTCQTGYVPDEYKKSCIVAPPTCQPGQLIVDNVCVTPPSSCEGDLVVTGAVCACPSGSVLRGGSTKLCEPCTTRFGSLAKTCDTNGIQSCVENYKLDGSGKCVCDDNHYVNDKGVCTTCPEGSWPLFGECICKDGYIKGDLPNTCKACSAVFVGSELCTDQGPYQCQLGWGLQSGACVKCPANAIACKEGAIVCDKGFGLSDDGKSCLDCKANPDLKTCPLECPANMLQSKDDPKKCVCDSNSIPNDKGGCDRCPDSSYIENGKCKCFPGLAVGPNGQCEFCWVMFPDSIECTSTGPTSCNPGLGAVPSPSGTGTVCATCPVGAVSCDNNKIQCDSAYVISRDGKSCIDCKTNLEARECQPLPTCTQTQYPSMDGYDCMECATKYPYAFSCDANNVHLCYDGFNMAVNRKSCGCPVGQFADTTVSPPVCRYCREKFGDNVYECTVNGVTACTDTFSITNGSLRCSCDLANHIVVSSGNANDQGARCLPCPGNMVATTSGGKLVCACGGSLVNKASSSLCGQCGDVFPNAATCSPNNVRSDYFGYGGWYPASCSTGYGPQHSTARSTMTSSSAAASSVDDELRTSSDKPSSAADLEAHDADSLTRTAAAATHDDVDGRLDDDDDDDRSSDDADDDEFEVEDLLWAAQMDLIGHRHASAIQKLQHAVALGSSAACATLGNLLSHGFRPGGEHASCLSPPLRSATMPDPITHAHASSSAKLSSVAATDASLKRPTPLRTATMPPAQSAGASHRDSLAAAELFATGLEIELGKPVQQDGSMSGDDRAVYSDEEGSEGRFFSLERALDLVVGLTDSFRFGILVPPPANGQHANGQLSLAEELWSKGAILAHQVLAHPSVTLTQPLLTSLSSSASSPRPRSLSRSLSRSYAHPSTNLPAPQMPSPHPHLSGETRLQLTVNVHLLYLLALHVWPSDKKRAEDYWKELVKLGSKGVGTKEGEEMVERAKRRIDNLHRDDRPDDDWHTAKARGRVAKTKKQQQLVERTTTGESFERSTGDALQEMKEEIERDKREARQRAQTLPSDVKGKGRALDDTFIGETEHSRFGSSSSAITIKPSQAADDARSSSSPTSQMPAARTPRPSKFHFGAEKTSNEYPSPPTTPPSTSSPVSAKHQPIESLAPNLLRTQTTEPDSYFTSQTDDQQDERSSPTKRSRTRTRTGSTASSRVPAWSLKQLTRTRSSASVATLPPDFGSSSVGRQWSASSSQAVLSQAVVPEFVSSTSREAATKTRSRSLSSGSNRSNGAGSSSSSKGWGSNWKAKFSALRNKPGQLFSSSVPTVDRGGASDLLRQVLVRDQTAAMYGGVSWDFDERDEGESGPEGEEDDESGQVGQNGDKDDEDPTPSPSSGNATPPTDINDVTTSGRSREQSNSTTHVNGTTSRKASRKQHNLRRVNSSLSQRSFFDPTTSDSRWTPPPPPNADLPESSNGLLSPTSAASALQTHPAPPLSRPCSRSTLPSRSCNNLKGRGGGGDAGMDPLLLELERKSRVGVKTVCASCGKKGLNYPKSVRGETFCSRECRMKGRKSGRTVTQSEGLQKTVEAGAGA